MSDSRAEFEAWLKEVHDLDAAWDESRNCFADFWAHLAYKAYQEGRAQPERNLPTPHNSGELARKLTDAEIRELAHNHLNGTGDHCIINFARALLAAQPAPAPLAEFAANLAAKQQPLPADMSKVLHDNLWELYARDEKAAQPAAVTVPEWISVEDRLPDDGAHVLITAHFSNNTAFDRFISFATFTNGEWISIDEVPLNDATHWMPSPPLPAAQAQDDGEKR